MHGWGGALELELFCSGDEGRLVCGEGAGAFAGIAVGGDDVICPSALCFPHNDLAAIRPLPDYFIGSVLDGAAVERVYV